MLLFYRITCSEHEPNSIYGDYVARKLLRTICASRTCDFKCIKSKVRIPVKSSTDSGSCRPAVEWSTAGEGIINQVDSMGNAARNLRCDSPCS